LAGMKLANSTVMMSLTIIGSSRKKPIVTIRLK
jgi:hypothetical protein